MRKVLFTATVDSHILQFHIPYLKMFKEQGYEVHVATNGDENIPYCDVKHKVPFERSPFKFNNMKAIKQLKKIINAEKFNIIHTHTPMGSVVTRIAAKKARKKYNTKIIYTAHGFHFFKGAPFLNWIMFYPVEKYLSKYTDCLITINKEDYNLAKKKFKAKNVEYVPGIGVDENKFNFEMSREERKELRKNLGINEEDFVIIYVAELSKRKNQQMLIKAISLLQPSVLEKVKVLLPGKDSMNGKYQELAKNLNVDKNIQFLGYRTDIPKLMKISDLAVSTSRQEGLPVNLMEAMFCNLPIIATDCRGNRDLIQKESIVEIDDENTLREKLLNQIHNYKNNKIEYKNISMYSWKNVEKLMYYIYKKMEE